METTGMLQDNVERIQQALLQTYVPTTQQPQPQQQQQQGISLQTSTATGINGQLLTQIHPVVGGNISSLTGKVITRGLDVDVDALR